MVQGVSSQRETQHGVKSIQVDLITCGQVGEMARLKEEQEKEVEKEMVREGEAVNEG